MADTVPSVIRAHVERVLADSPTRTAAIARLGIGRTTLYRWLRQWARQDARARRDGKHDS